MNEHEQLIEEARGKQCGCSGDYCDAGLVRRLTDALEAATRERDAVPDAATELAAIKARADEVGEDEGWHIGGAWGDYGEVVVPLRILSYVVDGALDEKIVSTDPGYAATYAEQVSRAEQAGAERDAALAAIERVRAIHVRDTPSIGGDWCLDDHHKWPCPTIQALDGAPEPEEKPCDAEVHSWDHFRPEQIDSYWIRCTMPGKHDEHEDSHTGLKWRSGLPVEGESNGES